MMVRSSAEKLTTDIADLEAVLAKAERPAVRAILDDQLVQLRNELTTLKPAQGAANRAPGTTADPCLSTWCT